jgi:hypothetical protein
MRRRYEVPEHHLRVAHALQAGGPAVPDSLLRRIEVLEAKPAVRRPARSLRPALASGVAVVVAMAVAAALWLGGPAGPTAVDAAALSPLPAERAAPRGFAGVDYPDWSTRFGWAKVGGRDDELGGRRTTTAFYLHTHHRIGYTVISGRAIELPAGAETITVKGLELHRFRLGAQDAVAFERNGRTCVLSGKVHDPKTLIKLAVAE